MTVIIAAALAGGSGFLVFRSRIAGMYSALITQALALLVSILFVGQQAYTGGTNGITDRTPTPSSGTRLTRRRFS